MARLAAILAALPLLAAEAPPHPQRGLYAIWLAKGQNSSQSFVKGGQVVTQWREVEPAPGKYDWTAVARGLEAMQKTGRSATVQINGNEHPAWLFERVPSTRHQLSIQVRDRQGTLAYWHPAYRDAYLRMVEAFGAWLRQSPLRESVLGVRLNFNALGTEHFEVPAEARAPEAWTVPAGIDPALPWTRQIGLDYRRGVTEAFVRSFVPDVRVFLRNNAIGGRDELPAEIPAMLDNGRLALFHTSSEMEPRKGSAGQYEAFLRYCRPGKTVCYAEPWADAWGRHGGKTDPRWCGPEQFNYWRLLVDLHCGVSFIALYGADLAHAAEPEFRAAFDFAGRYAGYHASPSAAPGAWVALREGNTLQGDYTFLMRRSGEMAALEKQGPADQRFGAWARALAPGAAAHFDLDPAFARSLKGDATVAVTYLDSKGTLTVQSGANRRSIRGDNSGRWRTQSWAADVSGGRVTLSSDTGAVLHMVEVRR
jgi:hypothetical protein